MNNNLGWNSKKDWTEFWSTTCHNIWMWHNKETCDGSLIRPPCMISHIYKITQDYERAKDAKNISLNTRRILRYVKWETPLVGLVKLNTDTEQKIKMEKQVVVVSL